MYELKKIGMVLTSKSVRNGPSSYEKNLPGRGLKKLEKHCCKLSFFPDLYIGFVTVTASFVSGYSSFGAVARLWAGNVRNFSFLGREKIVPLSTKWQDWLWGPPSLCHTCAFMSRTGTTSLLHLL